MFKAITWNQYVSVVSFLVLAYYAYVGMRYYHVELLGLVRGKGKAPASSPVAPRLAGKSSLIAKAALAIPAEPLEVGEPDETTQAAKEAGEETADEQLKLVAELPPFELPMVEVSKRNNYENDDESYFINDNSINFTGQGGSKSFLDTEGGMESANDDFSIGTTIGIAQLGNYLTSAVEGQLTPAQLVEKAPGLANTDLLLAFYQTSTKNAQRVTAHLYEGVAEPVLD